METINPYQNEQMTLTEEIQVELDRLEARKAYLIELLEHYESPGDLPTNL